MSNSKIQNTDKTCRKGQIGLNLVRDGELIDDPTRPGARLAPPVAGVRGVGVARVFDEIPPQ